MCQNFFVARNVEELYLFTGFYLGDRLASKSSLILVTSRESHPHGFEYRGRGDLWVKSPALQP
jgi:hypothetical protein